MNWSSASQFFEMGGYGLHVWGSYAVTFGLIALELVLLAARRQAIKKSAGKNA